MTRDASRLPRRTGGRHLSSGMSPGAQRPTERSTRSRPRAPLASYHAPMKPSPVRRFIAAGFGAGLIPRQLWGSDNGAGPVGAAVIAILIAPFPEYVHFAAIGIAVILSVWAPTPFLGTDTDPQWVAIDEVAGALIALTGLAGLPWLVGWVVFRIADIWKVLPGVPQAERLPGSLGITADDLVAGLYGLAAGSFVAFLI